MEDGLRTVEVGCDVETTSLVGSDRLGNREKTGREGTNAEAFQILAGDDRLRSGRDLDANARSARKIEAGPRKKRWQLC